MHRRKENFAACHVIMVDDVGTKVPEYRLELDPFYLFETSPGNFQAGYLLDPPEAERAKVERLLDEMVRCGLAMDGADPGMRGVTRYARLPVGQNNKAGDDTGTAYFEPSADNCWSGGFKCHHGHCQNHDIQTLIRYLTNYERLGREEAGHG